MLVIELRSPTDSLKTLQAKMEEYISVGVKLGCLINEVTAAPGACIRENCDPQQQQVEIYRPKTEVEIKY